MNDENRKNTAVDFLRLAAAGCARDIAERVLKPNGVHHNVTFARGWPALLGAMEAAAKQGPATRLEVKHVLCDGDVVAVHSHVVHKAGEAGAVVHLFRFEGDQIAEMWDVGPAIPPHAANPEGAS